MDDEGLPDEEVQYDLFSRLQTSTCHRILLKCILSQSLCLFRAESNAALTARP